MMKNLKFLALSLFILILSWCSNLSNKCDKNLIKETNPFPVSIYDEEPKDIIICNLNYWFSASVNDNEITEIEFDWPSTKNANLEIVISWILWETPKLKWNMWETELLKMWNWDVIYLIEITWAWNMVVYTYYTKQGILSMSKQYSILWEYPFSSLAMWFCK